MDQALTQLANHPALSTTVWRYLTTAQAMTGCRHVVGKAKVLLLVYRNHKQIQDQRLSWPIPALTVAGFDIASTHPWC